MAHKYLQTLTNPTRAALLALAGALALMSGAAPAGASPCRSNNWQPTFVHDLRPGYDAGPYYVLPGRGFVRLQEGNYVGDACSYIEQFGLRDQRGYTDCQSYTRVQCGCDEASRANATCDRFLQQMQARQGTDGLKPPTNSLVASLVGKWQFGRTLNRNQPTNQHLCALTLTDQFVPGKGYRINACHPNESYWNIEGDELVFRASDGRVSSRFSRSYDGSWEGPYVLNPSAGVRHYLRK